MSEFVKRKVTKKLELTGIQEGIMEILKQHVGKNKKISRPALLGELLKRGIQIDDRTMRENIEFLRTKVTAGAFICSSTSGGYWLAKNLAEVLEYCDQDARRAKMILGRINKQRQRVTRAITLTPLDGLH